MLALGLKGIDNEADLLKLTLQFKDEYLNIDAWHLYDDTVENLEYAINHGYTNYVLSNHVPELEELVTGLGIRAYFKEVITSGKVGYEKPHREMFKEIYKYGRFDSFYMIGDSYEADIMGALNFGINAILVRKENVNQYDKYSKDLKGVWKYV